MKYPILYLAAISLVSATVTVYDKAASRTGRRRVPERHLLLLGALGGSAAMYVTMLAVRHKTRHIKFMLGLPLIAAVQLSVLLIAITR